MSTVKAKGEMVESRTQWQGAQFICQRAPLLETLIPLISEEDNFEILPRRILGLILQPGFYVLLKLFFIRCWKSGYNLRVIKKKLNFACFA